MKYLMKSNLNLIKKKGREKYRYIVNNYNYIINFTTFLNLIILVLFLNTKVVIILFIKFN